MSHSPVIKCKSRLLRRKGYSYAEIANALRLSKSTAYSWTHEERLDKNAQNRIKASQLLSREKTRFWWKLRKQEWDTLAKQNSVLSLSKFKINNDSAKVLAACLFWAEGSKALNNMTFMNSDPLMIKTYLHLLRRSFSIKEEKFRVMLHLHEYHDEETMITYWSKITGIPIRQFYKVYLKPHTQKRKRENYLGSCSVRYYDASIARELTALYNALTTYLGL